MKLKDLDLDILRTLRDGNDKIGMSLYEIDKQRKGGYNVTFNGRMGLLEENGYIEPRWQGEPWPGESTAPDKTPTGKDARRFYRLTPKGKDVNNS
jgi:hypothetical protein